MAKTIAILGVTGNQGGSVARHFLSLGWNVRGITRSITSPSALALASLGVSLVTADIDSPSTLLPAFRSAHVIFAVTDFWFPFFSSFPSLSQVSPSATGQHAFDIEVQRGKNIVDAVVSVEKEEGSVLERFIYSTLPSFKQLSGGKYTSAYHFDGKAVVSAYLRGKKELWEKSSLLNMAFYTTNLITFGTIVGGAKNMVDGKFIFRTAGAPTAKHPFVVPTDTGLFIDLLVRSPPKQDFLGVSETGSYQQFMEIWSEVTGVPSAVEEETVDAADKAAPGGIGKEVAESSATSAEFGWGDLVMPTDLEKDFKTTSIKEYMQKEDWKPFLASLSMA